MYILLKKDPNFNKTVAFLHMIIHWLLVFRLKQEQVYLLNGYEFTFLLDYVFSILFGLILFLFFLSWFALECTFKLQSIVPLNISISVRTDDDTAIVIFVEVA